MVANIFQSILGFATFAFVVFIFVLWLWLLISVIGDLFRRHDIGGFGKVLWIIFLVLLPYLGVFAYILTQGRGMGERQVEQVKQAQKDLREFVGVSPADELEKLEKLKAAGTISPEEFSKLRAKVIG
ncbi:SHOCT domain-containing protein [Sandaracinobacteroides hominis]|uniref:SHOCT domain-containing protein n=1 Tax=Sandaracinobacteroides hominis TaxID=2780086 RepID=UPI0018F76089|nr:SHOCT domain-containing protein [Sandaracinobacteroides hominis]